MEDLKHRVLVLIVLFLFGAFLRLAFIGDKSINPDESWTIHQGKKGWTYVTDGWKIDAHPPLRYLPYYYWLKVAEKNDGLLRLPSALFSLCTIPLLYLFGSKFLSSRAALLATGLFTISPFSVLYANFASMYSFFPLITLTILYAFLQGMRGNKWPWWIVFVVAQVVGLYSHYYFFLLLFVENLVFLFWGRERPLSWGAWFGLQALIGLAFLPWLPMFWDQFTSARDVALMETPKEVHSILKLLYCFYCFSLGESVDPTNLVIVIPAVLLFAPLFVYGIISLIKYENRVGLAIVIFLLVPLAIASFRRVTFPKHLLLIYPAYCVILAAGIFSLRRRVIKGLVITGIAIISFYSLFSYYTNRELHNPDIGLPWKEVANQISLTAGQDDLILLYPDVKRFFNYYYRGSAPQYVLTDQMGSSELTQALKTLPTHRTLYTILHCGGRTRSGGWTRTEEIREQIKALLSVNHLLIKAERYRPNDHFIDAIYGRTPLWKKSYVLEVHSYRSKLFGSQ
jgi:uncharacterized membrane protein